MWWLNLSPLLKVFWRTPSPGAILPGAPVICLTSITSKTAKKDTGRLSRFCVLYTEASSSNEVNWELTVIALCELEVLNMILWPADLMHLLPGLSFVSWMYKNNETIKAKITGVSFRLCITLKKSGRVAWVSSACIILIPVDSHKCKAGLDYSC